MPVHPQAGTLPQPSQLTDIARLITAYFADAPDASVPAQRVSFGTSGHRGSSFASTFNEAHILAITQAICEYRAAAGVSGPLFVARDTHALSEPAFVSALEVLAANDVQVLIDAELGYTPTPALSHAILKHNRGRQADLADGIVLTPSHNPPEDGGFKYNPTHGGPADTSATKAIEKRANEILANGCSDVRRVPYRAALGADSTHRYDFVSSYIDDLGSVVDLDAIRGARLKLAADPLGGAGVAYWPRIEEKYGIGLTVLSRIVDPTFRFMTLDWDGRIRMDCSSPYAMQSVLVHKSDFDLAFACDTDHDRHGIVTRAGLMNPNHFLAVCIWYLFQNRPHWGKDTGIGKTQVSSSIIDRVVENLGRRMLEVPVGFKWFVDGLLDGSLGFVGEESAGASFLRRDGTVWSTDKDGIIMGLLAAEILARTGKDPAQIYGDVTKQFGEPFYARVDAPADPEQKAILGRATPSDLAVRELAGEPVIGTWTTAPGNGAPLGGVKMGTKNAWFAARPSGTENVYKIYAESFVSREHLDIVLAEAQNVVSALFRRT